MKKILIVDDNREVLESIKTLLEINKFKISGAKDGEECIKKVKNEKFDLILLDMIMPGLTTREIVAKLNELKIKTPIILLSGSRIGEMKQKLESENPNRIVDFIEKPFENDNFIARVKKAILNE